MTNKIYEIDLKSTAIDDLKRLDKHLSGIIVEKIEKHLAVEPQLVGKPLKGDLKGYWKYRIKGDYRVGYKISKDETLIIILIVGHRKEVYERFKKLVLKLKS
ncbi:MAG: Toxin RelG [Mycoplasmataceae bacterium]|nr:MAG: Toxin RelG [Mycoplasmataceae bacterium]